MKKTRTLSRAINLSAAVLLFWSQDAVASSHREAPFIAKNPKSDGTDFYMFRSYEPGREGFVTFLANYIPLEDPYGGPSFFTMDPLSLYEIHVDNNADAVEDLTFQFRFQLSFKNIELAVGTGTSAKMSSVPLYNTGPITADNTGALNVEESYTLTLVRGDRRRGTPAPITNTGGGMTFRKPADHVGTKTFADYESYARTHIHPINIPGCAAQGGRVFVGQRKDPFVVNLGQIFDLINISPADVTGQSNCDTAASRDTLANKNVTTIALEVPIACLTQGGDPVIGGWTTASVRQARVINPRAKLDRPTREGGPWAQISRLGHPLVNEVVIGLRDKDRFNTSQPKEDAQLFLDYVTHPTLAKIVGIVFMAAGPLEPQVFPRTDLVNVFLAGVEGLNRPTTAGATPSEELRLNTNTLVTPIQTQSRLGVIGGDNAGYPNGRRPADDVVDIELRVMMGRLLPTGGDNPARDIPFTDCAPTAPGQFDATFPYVRTPIPGSM